MAGQPPLFLLLLVTIFLCECVSAHENKPVKRKRCWHNGKLYDEGEVGEISLDQCVRLRCFRKGIRMVMKLELIKDCTCGIEEETESCEEAQGHCMRKNSILRKCDGKIDMSKKCNKKWESCCFHAETDECPTICPENYDPVCGSDGETYSNACQLSIANCQHPLENIVTAYVGVCRPEECPTTCFEFFAPVCGSDGETYSNLCKLTLVSCQKPLENIVIAYIGECRPECPTICPFLFDRVCGSDGNTYINPCELSIASCKNPFKNITIVDDAECLPETTQSCEAANGTCMFFPFAKQRCEGKINKNKKCKNKMDSCCIQAETPECPTICPFNFEPVCGSGGNTHFNPCELTVANCQNPLENITAAYDGECRPEPCPQPLCVCSHGGTPVLEEHENGCPTCSCNDSQSCWGAGGTCLTRYGEEYCDNTIDKSKTCDNKEELCCIDESKQSCKEAGGTCMVKNYALGRKCKGEIDVHHRCFNRLELCCIPESTQSCEAANGTCMFSLVSEHGCAGKIDKNKKCKIPFMSCCIQEEMPSCEEFGGTCMSIIGILRQCNGERDIKHKCNSKLDFCCVPECVEGSTWKQDCNKCVCKNGLVICTKKACNPLIKDACLSLSPPGYWIGAGYLGARTCEDDNATSTDISRPGGQCCQPIKCVEGSTWNQDCNKCMCTNGLGRCTKKACNPPIKVDTSSTMAPTPADDAPSTTWFTTLTDSTIGALEDGCVGYNVTTGSHHLCFSFSHDMRNWTDAAATCFANGGGKLATLVNVNPAEFWTYVTTNYGKSMFWLGGSDAANEGDWAWMDGSQFWNSTSVAEEEGVFPWGNGVPDGTGDCLLLELNVANKSRRNGCFDSDCSSEHRYVCEYADTISTKAPTPAATPSTIAPNPADTSSTMAPTSGETSSTKTPTAADNSPSNTSSTALTESTIKDSTIESLEGECVGYSVTVGAQHLCFSFSDDKRNWTDAAATCVANGGGMLATLVETTEFLTYVTTNFDPSIFWLGGSDAVNEGDWNWMDGTRFWNSTSIEEEEGSFPWVNGVPDGDGNCLEVYFVDTNYSYGYDKPCSNEQRYVCQYADTAFTMPPTPAETASTMAPTHAETASTMAPTHSETASTMAPTPAETASTMAPTHAETATTMAPTPSETASSMAPTPAETASTMAPTSAETASTMAPTPAETDSTIAPTHAETASTKAATLSTTIITMSSGISDCGCDYSTFSSSHTMNKYTGPDQSCGAYKKTGVTEEEIKTILKTHNNRRDEVAKGLETQGSLGPQPSAKNMFELKWNCELAEVAQRWAERCTLDHDNGDDRKICNQDYAVGQNVYQSWSFDAASVWEVAIFSWYNEVKNMPQDLVNSFESPPTGAPVIGSYTQVVWAETYEVGCGAIHFPDSIRGTNYPETKVYVCNYGPGGNTKDRQIYEIGTAASNCPNGVSSDFSGLCAPPS